MFRSDYQRKFNDLQAALSESNRGQLKFNANGGNTVLFAYPPHEERDYINKARELLKDNEYEFIDIRKVLISFIESIGVENLDRYFEALKLSTEQIFKAADERIDFYDMIIAEIEKVVSQGKYPVLIHTGALFGTGVDNLHIMEHTSVINSGVPLVILYPASHVNDRLMYLNCKPSSKYRCHIID